MRKEQIADKLITYVEENNNKKMTKKDANKIVEFIFETIVKELEVGGTVKIAHFGSFSVSLRDEYKGMNPKTKESIIIAKTLSPHYKASFTLKSRLNKASLSTKSE